LQHSVEIAHVDAQLERGRADDAGVRGTETVRNSFVSTWDGNRSATRLSPRRVPVSAPSLFPSCFSSRLVPLPIRWGRVAEGRVGVRATHGGRDTSVTAAVTARTLRQGGRGCASLGSGGHGRGSLGYGGRDCASRVAGIAPPPPAGIPAPSPTEWGGQLGGNARSQNRTAPSNRSDPWEPHAGRAQIRYRSP